MIKYRFTLVRVPLLPVDAAEGEFVGGIALGDDEWISSSQPRRTAGGAPYLEVVVQAEVEGVSVDEEL